MVGDRSRPAISSNPKPRAPHAYAFDFCYRKVKLAPIDRKQRAGQSIRIALDVRPNAFKIKLAIKAARIFWQGHVILPNLANHGSMTKRMMQWVVVNPRAKI